MKQALVLKKFEMPESSSDGLYLNIEGRRSGIVSFLLTLLKLNPVTTFRCYHDRIEFMRASLSGEQQVTIPLTAVTAVLSGSTKPISYFIAGVLFIVFAIIIPIYMNVAEDLFEIKQASGSVATACIVISLLAFLFYILKKDMNIHVQNGGDTAYGLVFKRSVIENIPVDIVKVKKAARLVNAAVLQATYKK